MGALIVAACTKAAELPETHVARVFTPLLLPFLSELIQATRESGVQCSSTLGSEIQRKIQQPTRCALVPALEPANNLPQQYEGWIVGYRPLLCIYPTVTLTIKTATATESNTKEKIL
jgi:hypothetical protein